MDKEKVIKMIDEYLSETNISKEWIEALTFCKKELTKSEPMYINHPLCDACRDYGDIAFKDCNKCEVRDEFLRDVKCKKCIHRTVCKFNIETGITKMLTKIVNDSCLAYMPISAVRNESEKKSFIVMVDDHNTLFIPSECYRQLNVNPGDLLHLQINLDGKTLLIRKAEQNGK